VRSILSPEARPILERLAIERALLAFDFDGTLAPIVPDRNAARMQPSTRRLLRALSLLYPCAVISGRSRSDVAARLGGVPLIAIVGNHGAEAGRGPLDRTRRARLLAWKLHLGAKLSAVPGIEVEDKGFSIAVHYRHVPSRPDARALVVRAAEDLDGARVFGGHAVVNVVPANAADKGTALEGLIERAGPRPVLYVGDDRTDESAFRSPAVAVGVRVGRTARSAAAWYVARQSEVDALLCALLSARTRVEGLGEGWEGLARAVDP
jgi:trehalose 6-phosphate phosphatase